MFLQKTGSNDLKWNLFFQKEKGCLKNWDSLLLGAD